MYIRVRYHESSKNRVNDDISPWHLFRVRSWRGFERDRFGERFLQSETTSPVSTVILSFVSLIWRITVHRLSLIILSTDATDYSYVIIAIREIKPFSINTLFPQARGKICLLFSNVLLYCMHIYFMYLCFMYLCLCIYYMYFSRSRRKFHNVLLLLLLLEFPFSR